MSGAVATLKQRAEDAERRASRLRKAAELAEELGDEGLSELVALLSEESSGNGNTNGNGNGHDAPKREGPRGREAIRRVVGARPGIWTLPEIRAALDEQGWSTTPKGVEVAMVRLAKAGECRRVGKGVYEFPGSDRKEDVIESDPSDGALIPLRP